MYNVQLIEQGRIAPQGRIIKEDDLLWEGYLQLHVLAEKMGLLSEDSTFHALLDSRLETFEMKYQECRE